MKLPYPAARVCRFAALALSALVPLFGRPSHAEVRRFLDTECADCHDGVERKGELDLTALTFEPQDPKNLARWVQIYDRVASGEMPPKKRERPPVASLTRFQQQLAKDINKAEAEQTAKDGRSIQRRLNRYEYENALRDLLSAPWLQIRDALPEDGEAFRFNKVGEALAVSHVQLSRYLTAADYALRQVLAGQIEKPAAGPRRYYARDQESFTRPMTFTVFNTSPERATFPVLGTSGQPEVRSKKQPITVGEAQPDLREQEAVGMPAGSYEPLEPKFNRFRAPVAGRYRIKIDAYSVWIGPTRDPKKWFIPDLDDVSAGRRSEPVTVYAETPPRQLRLLGRFDATPTPAAHELDVWLLAGEMIRPDPARLFRSRPGASRWQNPLAEKDGQPGVAFRWLEVEGPLNDTWPSAGHRLLFGDLPLKKNSATGALEVISEAPKKDAPRLLREFLSRAYRRPINEGDVRRFQPVIDSALKSGASFTEAMIAGYTAVLCSPGFVCLEENPGKLDDYALASRLSFFLWNSPPDAALLAEAQRQRLRRPDVLRAQTERLLNDPKAERFVAAFLDYWLDLRRIAATGADEGLYPDYYLDDLLTESALEESRHFFAELLRRDLPARNVVASDFAMLNERLAKHYGLTDIEGAAIRRVPLSPDSVRGGFLTQASVLKVTANGTTTSPVTRGAWIMERILAQPPPPPPASVPAIEPDIRGASTIRQQLDKHRTLESCSSCHVKIDPPGFALESFDVLGGWRDRYRAMGDGKPDPGLGKGGQKFAFHSALPVDCSGQMADGRNFADIREFKRLLLANESQIARGLANHLIVFSTGAPVRFSDRPALEKILERSAARHYGVKTLIQEIVQSDLFRSK